MSFFDFLFYKKKFNPITIREEHIAFEKDPKLSASLTELKTVAFQIESKIKQDHDEKRFYPPYFKQYKNFCNNIEDLLEVFKTDDFSDSVHQTVNPINIAKDFSERLSTKYDLKTLGNIVIFIDDGLPIIQTYPDDLIKLIDCITRSSVRISPETKLVIEISNSGNGNLLSPDIDWANINFTFKNINFAVDIERANQLINEFYTGYYNNALELLGVELCSALHIAYRKKAEIQLLQHYKDNNILSITMPLQISKTGYFTVSVLPTNFYVYTNEPTIISALSSIAKQGGVKCSLTKKPTKLKNKHALVFDATSEDNYKLLLENKFPERTVIILPSYDLNKMRELSTKGFYYFLCLPLISSQFFYSLQQTSFTKYKPSSEKKKCPAINKLNVLLVDDSITARLVLLDYFESQGHNVKEASDGHELVSLIKNEEKFDVVFCDQTMPNMDGVDAVKIVRKLEANKNHKTTIILVTAYDTLEQEEVNSLFDFVIKKPITISNIEAILKKLNISFNQTINSALNTSSKKTEIIDLEDLRSRCSGKDKIIYQILDAFIENSKKYLTNLEIPEQRTNVVNLKRILHSLNGLLKDAGAKASSELIKNFEFKVTSEELLNNEEYEAIKNIFASAIEDAEKIKRSLSI